MYHVWALAAVTTLYLVGSLIPGLRTVFRDWAARRKTLIEDDGGEDDEETATIRQN